MAQRHAFSFLLLFLLPLCAPAKADTGTPAVGLHLTGHASNGQQTWQFEIVMQGHDHYFRKEWDGKQDNPSMENQDQGFWRVEMAQDDFGGKMSQAWDFTGNGGSKGGGSYNETGGKSMGMVARRLWQDDKFRGVKPDELREAVEDGHILEEFSAPILPGGFPVPLTIRWGTTIYTVETAEFTAQANPAFFDAMRKQYFTTENDSREVESREKADARAAAVMAQQLTKTEAQRVAADALGLAKTNQDAAVANLRAALVKLPSGASPSVGDQSWLLSALWQIRGVAEKDEVVNWFYDNLPHKSHHHHDSFFDGPDSLLFSLKMAHAPNLQVLITALIADPRFDQTDPSAVEELMDMAYEGFPIPPGDSWRGKDITPPISDDVARQMLPAWRNVLRRHYGLPEEIIPATTSI